jgi:hypothetical protein
MKINACSICKEPLDAVSGTCACFPSHGEYHLTCDPHKKKDVIFGLVSYIFSRLSLAEKKEILTTAGNKNSVSHGLVSDGMVMGYKDVLGYLENHGVSSSVRK